MAPLTLPQAMQQAATAYVRGDLVTAEQWCRSILNAEAMHFDALSLLGVIAARTRRSAEAADFLARAVRARPNDATAHNNYGIALKNLRRFDEALRSYERALEIQPDFADAHYNQGNVRKELKRFEEALASYERALAINPGYAEVHINRGIALQTLGRVVDALDGYERAIAINGNYAEAHYNRGVALLELRRVDDALQSYGRALEINRNYAEAHHGRGVALLKLRRAGEALDSHERALRIKPDFAEACNGRGVALQELRRFDDALASFDRALHIKPDYAEAYTNRGVALQDLQRFEEALGSHDGAIRIKPNYAEAHYNRANALKELERFEEALDGYERAINLKPDYAEAHNNRGNALEDLGRFDQALNSFQRALIAKPDYAAPYFNLGNALAKLGRLDEALENYGRAIEIAPEHAEACNNRGNVLNELRRPEEALGSYARALAIKPDFEWLYGTWLHTKMRLCQWCDFNEDLHDLVVNIERARKITPPFPALTLVDSLSVQRKAAQTWLEHHRPSKDMLAPIEKRGRGERIRIGYYSADFHNHATAHLIAELFEKHDRTRFELVAFSFGPDIRDDMRQRLSAAFDEFVDVSGNSDKEIAQFSRQRAIDIAVDLKGFTQDERHGIFFQRAAPIQVSYLGYPGTMAAQCIDYIVADRLLIPIHSRLHYSEKIAYLPNSYQVNDRRRRIADEEFSRADLGLPPTGFVFCCFNGNYKITPETFGSWMRILGQVEGSILWLLGENQAAVGNLRREAQVRGVNAARLVFAQRMPPPEHLARHRAADLFLDTLPCNAHTTASDALWAGLPVLTRVGESFAARVAASLLNAIGLPELITTTQEQYETLAIELAQNPRRLAEIAEKLRANRSTTPLFDTELFTRHLEDAYTQMYERYLADVPPGDIHVAP